MEYGLIGAKLGHSFSREIHARIADYDYELCELSPDGVAELMKERSFRAINVTIPYKETVIPMLDVISENAAKIGAVNTVVNRGGRLYGYNTDYAGASALIRRAGVEIKDKKVLILGTGGTSKTMRAVVGDMGAASVIGVSRRSGGENVTYDEAARLHSDADVIINTTPVGMFPSDDGCPIDISIFHSLSGVIDVIYNPLSTRLVTEARKRGVPAEGGLYMLAAQAVCASALFLGKADSESSLDTALCDSVFRSVLAQKQNIVLIGMPSSGKSTVGARISELTGRELVDTDVLISEKTGRAITEIFATDGEAAFRALEREAVAEVSRRSGIIIATGGGAVLDPRNVDKLKQNGVLFFLDRPLGLLCATADRPLSRDASALARRYEERYPVYTSVCDVRVPGEGSVNEVAELVLGGIQNENSRN